MQQQVRECRGFAQSGAQAQLRPTQPCSARAPSQRAWAPAHVSRQGRRRVVTTAAAGESQRTPVMRQLESSAPAVSGAAAAISSAPGFSSTAPGFAAPQAGAPATPIGQIPVSAGSRPAATTPYVPKTVSLFDAMRFSGPAPETINGRLAMVGFLAGAVAEVRTGLTLEQQALGAGPATVALAALIVYSSLVPMLKAAKTEPFGIFTPAAEATNGRAAMLGFAVLLVLEHSSGVCFF